VLRLLRFVSFFASLVLPGLYVAILTFHQEMMPTVLILSIAAQREGVPFPGAVETFLMELTFELLREAGTRLPRLVGPAISIIGALVLGDAAIRAGLVSPAMVVVVAFTGIASFSTPLYSMAIGARILRFALIILGGTLGLFGIIAGLFALLIHLCTLRSFGTPFLEPLAPVVLSDWKDALVRLPWWAMRTRPRLLGVEDPVRQVPGWSRCRRERKAKGIIMSLDKISPRQAMAMLIISRLMMVTILFPALTEMGDPQNIWLVGLLGMLIAVPLILLVVALGLEHPDKTIIQYSQVLLGKFFGKIVGLVLVWYWFHIAVTSAAALGESLTSAIMVETPDVVLIGTIAYLGASAARNGVEVMARVAENALGIIMFFGLGHDHPAFQCDEVKSPSCRCSLAAGAV
jgi:hypothetical protein